MRMRSITLASGVVALVLPVGAVAAPSHAPHRNNGLTITALPSSIIAGEGVTIQGELKGSDISGQKIDLYHRIAGRGGYSLVSRTTTNSEGVYEFTRAEGVVMTNRSWYATAPGLAGHVHSRTAYERVAAELSLSASTTSTDTKTPVTFTGTITPAQPGARIALQVESGASGSGWSTIAHTRVGVGSSFSITHRFATAGDRDVRALFTGNARNTAAASVPVTISVQQAQVAGFSIASSASSAAYGTGTTISGVLDQPGTTTPESGTSVSLWQRGANGRWHVTGTPATTGSDGGYSFSVDPAVNSVYQARTTYAPRRASAVLHLGVHDVVAMTPSATSTTVGGTVTFTGAVSPDKAGSVVYLERLGSDGSWHVVAVKRITHASTYAFSWTFARAGSDQFRVQVPSDGDTLGGVSAAATITVSAAA